jgi:hypothetical protein
MEVQARSYGTKNAPGLSDHFGTDAIAPEYRNNAPHY